MIGDLDGLYDPSSYNDRLLLGLKGTMSEAELHILKQRMHQGAMQKARRGELVALVPVGYVRRPSGEVSLDPDEQVQAMLRAVFEQFERQSSVGEVLRYLIANRIQLPARATQAPKKVVFSGGGPTRNPYVTFCGIPFMPVLILTDEAASTSNLGSKKDADAGCLPTNGKCCCATTILLILAGSSTNGMLSS